MTTTYKPLTPGEALDALIRGENVEYRYDLDAAVGWKQACREHYFKAPLEFRYQYRLVIEPKPETVIGRWIRATGREENEQWYRDLVVALKHEIKSELREEMKR